MTFTHFLSETLPLIITAIGSIGATRLTLWKMRVNKEKQKKTSTDLLYEQLEELKTKIIEMTMEQITAADKQADVEIILHRMKSHCEACYSEVISQVEQTQNL